MNKPCATQGCPNTIGRGASYCADHAPPPWDGRSGNTMPQGWQRTRRRIMQRDRYECQFDMTGAGLICGARATEVDHITPRSEGGTDDPENLMAICHKHHLAKTQMESARGRTRR